MYQEHVNQGPSPGVSIQPKFILEPQESSPAGC